MREQYHVVVRQSLLEPNKWGVYLVPVSQPELEIVEWGYGTRDQAATAALNVSKKYASILGFRKKPIKLRVLIGKDVIVDESPRQPHGEYERIIGDEKTIKSFLQTHVTNLVKAMEKFEVSKVKIDPKSFLKLLLTSPFPLALIGILVYYGGLHVAAPDWIVPLLPKGLTRAAQFIIAIPFLICIYVGQGVFRRRSMGYQMNSIRNYLLVLILKSQLGPQALTSTSSVYWSQPVA